jgi:3'(2'), 5'-bisphosphate nucleotidase
MGMKKRNEIKVLKALAVEAGQAIMKVYQTDFAVGRKADDSPLTLADKTANEIIITGLRQSFPEYAILSEESRDDLSRLQNAYCFIVDPLDGTKEFIQRNGQFTVNIALVCRQRPVMGIIYVPVSGQLYFAGSGIGAWKEKAGSGLVAQLKVSDRIDRLVVVGSRSHASAQEAGLMGRHSHLIAETITAGSSLKGCMVAEGKADVYYRFGPTCEWDTAAMQCLVEAAGGIFRQMDGSEMLYNRTNTLNDKGFFIVNRVENIWI